MGHAENGNDEKSPSIIAIGDLPTEKYQQVLRRIIENNCGVVDDNVIKIDAASAKGDNYIGLLYRAVVKGKNFNVIIKLPPQNAIRREQFMARPCFIRESEFYDVVYPMFKRFQEDKGIDVEKDGFHQVPHCFESLTEEPYEGLFMEDLKASKFEMFDRHKDTTAEHVNLVMAALGKYHAISFAIKDQQPELIEGYRGMKDIFIQRDNEAKDQMKPWFDLMKQQAIDSVKDDEDLTKTLGKIVETKDFIKLMEECVTGGPAEPYAVLTHGDCWNNNIMFRNENEIPVEVRLLDWQIMRYATPVCDLVYYIFACTTKDLRDKHYLEFLNTYYSSLASFVTRLGSDPSKVFPRKAFLEHLNRFGRFGLIMAIVCLPIFTSNADEAPDIDIMVEKMQDLQDNGTELKMDELQFTTAKTLDVYNKRMAGVIQDMSDLGYI